MPKISSLGPLEQAVMDVLWQRETATVRDIWTALQPTHPTAYTTILTILSRLHEKELVAREKQGKQFSYRSKTDKQQTVQSFIKQTLDQLVDRFGEEAVTAFIDEAQHRTPKQKRT